MSLRQLKTDFEAFREVVEGLRDALATQPLPDPEPVVRAPSTPVVPAVAPEPVKDRPPLADRDYDALLALVRDTIRAAGCPLSVEDIARALLTGGYKPTVGAARFVDAVAAAARATAATCPVEVGRSDEFGPTYFWRRG